MRDRLAARSPSGAARVAVVVREHDVDEVPDIVGVERREVLGERVALGLAELGRHVAT